VSLSLTGEPQQLTETTQPSSYGTCSFTPDADSEGFVAFEALTESDVLEWVYEALDKDAVEASIATQIEAQKAPVTMTGLPWN
jgi:hypothetical protein